MRLSLSHSQSRHAMPSHTPLTAALLALTCILSLLTPAAWVSYAHANDAPEPAAADRSAKVPATSAVCRLTLPNLVLSQYDLELVLFHRDGQFHHGYARLPQRDNLAHRVDITPPPPIRFETADGQPIDVPESMRGYYAYNRPEFKVYRGQYERGEIRVAHPTEPAPLARAGRSLKGMVDVLILGLDESNSPGRDNHALAYRIDINAAVPEKVKFDGSPNRADDLPLEGSFTAWQYAENDDTYGQANPRTRGKLTGRWDSTHWTPSQDTAFAPGKDWPQVRGPMLNGSAVPTDANIVDHLHDARLLWVAEEALGGGRSGALSRGDFQMYPVTWSNTNFAGFGGPIVVKGVVYLQLLEPDMDRLASDPAVPNNIYVRLGADPRVLANTLGHMRDALYAIDAQTGRTLWMFRSNDTFRDVPDGKGGRGTTACHLDGKLYLRGAGGMYCLDAQTGQLLWRKRNENGVDYSLHSRGPGGAGIWSRDVSPVAIGGVIIFRVANTLVGIDPTTGDVRWRIDNVAGPSSVPTKVTLDGKPYIIACSRLFVPSKRDLERGAEDVDEKLSLIDPTTGNIIWQNEALGSNAGTLTVWNDIVVGNGRREITGKNADDQHRAAGVQLSLKGATPLWQSDQLHYQGSRNTPIAHNGFAYLDSRLTGFNAVNMRTGQTINRHPHIYHMTGGSHNWTWHIATNDRIFTSGILMFTDAAHGFELMPGRLSVDQASGYTCPIKPAIADGRLFVRTSDKLLCYDLRKKADAPTTTALVLTANNAIAGRPADASNVSLRIRVRDGQPISLAADSPRLLGREARLVNNWVHDSSRAPWQATVNPTLTRKGDTISGQAAVQLGFHEEAWRFTIEKQGDRFVGEYTRTAQPLSAGPMPVKGNLTGRFLTPEDQPRLWVLELAKAVDGGPSLAARTNDILEDLTIAIAVNPDNTIHHAWACSGRVNGAAWEVDPTHLTITDDKLAGQLTVLIRDDDYFDVHYESAQQQFRDAGAGGLLAATYTVNAKRDGQAIAGDYSGNLGVAWSRTGTLVGAVVSETPGAESR